MFAGKPGKRLYKRAQAAVLDETHVVLLDERPLQSPARRRLELPNVDLAKAIAAEWAAQEERIAPATMPLTQLACTAVDLVAPKRQDVVAELAAFGGSDLVCYWAESPDSLVRRQQAAWQPLLDWLEVRFGARLTVAAGVMPVQQPPEALDILHRSVEARSDWELVALASAVRASGSLAIGLALLEARLTPCEAFAAAEVDQSYQMEKWGEDSEALARRAALQQELSDTARFLRLLGG